MLIKLKNILTALAFLILLQPPTSAQTIIKKIYFEGLKSTNIDHLHNFLKSSEGDTLDISKIEEDEVFLRNSQYFSDATCSISENGKNAVVTFSVKEKQTLLPIFNFNVIESNYFVQIGAVEFNLFGNWNTLGGYYQYYDRSSYSLFSDFKNIVGSRFGIIGRYSKLSTTEPAYFNNGTTYFDVDKYSTELLFTYDFTKELLRNPRIKFGLGLNYLAENYYKNLKKSGDNSPGPNDDERKKVILKSTLSLIDIDYYFEYLNGYSFHAYYDNVSEEDDMFGFQQILTEVRYYKSLLNKINAAARLRIGVSTNKFSPFIPFLIDNYVNVRGAGDRAARGSAELSFNIEIRTSIFRNSWTALQLVNFLDYGSIRPGGEKLSSIYKTENIYSTAGVGARIHLLNFYNAIFRLDYGFSLQQGTSGFFVIGLGHFF